MFCLRFQFETIKGRRVQKLSDMLLSPSMQNIKLMVSSEEHKKGPGFETNVVPDQVLIHL